jgi:deoxyadenosine/deoxycytidine kinase
VTGPVGVGKSAVAGAIADRLEESRLPHAFVDIDSLRWHYPRPADDRFSTRLALRNLAAIWPNFQAAGAERLILADVLEDRADLERYRVAVPGAEILVVRLRASAATLAERVRGRGRDHGGSLDWHLHRSAELAEQMDRDRAEDLLVETDDKPHTAVANEILARSGWLRLD